jgi:predicted RNase H-like nuclease (RuvC/YqgF family)
VEDRLGKIEAHVEHMRSDISDLKIDVRRLNDKIDDVDKRLSDKIDDVNKGLSAKTDEVDKRLTGKIDGLKDSMEKEFRKLDRERLYDRVWYLLIAGTILGVMAHGFKWF